MDEKKYKFDDTIMDCYKYVCKNMLKIKSAFMGLCTNIERSLKLKFGIDINKPINEGQYNEFCYSYENLSGLSLEQLNRLLIVVANIRNINAHLNEKGNILLDDDLKEYLELIATPHYSISKKGRLTIYGAFYVLSFFSIKTDIWIFINSIIRKEYFDIATVDDMVKMQHDYVKYFSAIVGRGTAEFIHIPEPFDKNDIIYINDLNRANLTRIFFDFERGVYSSEPELSESRSVAVMILKEKHLSKNKEAASNFVRLRNSWFHGNWLYDNDEDEHGKYTLTLEFVLDTLKSVKETLCSDSNFSDLCISINNYALSLFNFFGLRLVEVSYKILDKRLLTTDKVDSRTSSTALSYSRFEPVAKKFFEKISYLIDQNYIKWEPTYSKFTDKIVRRTSTENLKIIRLESENGFDIGDFHANCKVMYLADVYLTEDFYNKINGKYLKEYKFVKEFDCSKFVTLGRAE